MAPFGLQEVTGLEFGDELLAVFSRALLSQRPARVRGQRARGICGRSESVPVPRPMDEDNPRLLAIRASASLLPIHTVGTPCIDETMDAERLNEITSEAETSAFSASCGRVGKSKCLPRVLHRSELIRGFGKKKGLFFPVEAFVQIGLIASGFSWFLIGEGRRCASVFWSETVSRAKEEQGNRKGREVLGCPTSFFDGKLGEVEAMRRLLRSFFSGRSRSSWIQNGLIHSGPAFFPGRAKRGSPKEPESREPPRVSNAMRMERSPLAVLPGSGFGMVFRAVF